MIGSFENSLKLLKLKQFLNNWTLNKTKKNNINVIIRYKKKLCKFAPLTYTTTKKNIDYKSYKK